MILKGISYLISREGSLSKYLLFLDKFLDHNDFKIDDKSSFKDYFNYVKRKTIYFESYDINNYSGKVIWIIFDSFKIESKNIYEEVFKENSIVIPTIFSYIKSNINENFSIENETSKVFRKDFYFYSVHCKGIIIHKDDSIINNGLFKLKSNLKIFYCVDYILFDIAGFSDKIIKSILNNVGVESYLKFLFNNLTCISLNKRKLKIASIIDYNERTEEAMLDRNSSSENNSYHSLDKELEHLLHEDNFNFDKDLIIELLLYNPFIFSLIFENSNSLIPLFYLEVVISFIVKEISLLEEDDSIEKEYVKLIHNVYLIYVIKLLQNGRSVPDTTSLGKILDTDTLLISGSSLLKAEDVVEGLRNIIKVREFMLKGEGDFTLLKSTYSSLLNVTPFTINNFSLDNMVSLSLKELMLSLNVLCHSESGYVCLKSDYRMNQFLRDFLKKTSNMKLDCNKYEFILEKPNNFTSDQVAAMNNIIYNNLIVVSGRPGTGKTYTISKFVFSLIEKKNQFDDYLFLMLSFTNKAVNKLNEYMLNNLYTESEIKDLFGKVEDKDRLKIINNHKNLWLGTIDLFVWEVYKNTDSGLVQKLENCKKIVVVLDEVGMISLDKFNIFLSTLINLYGEEFYKKLEKIIFSGDYAQLISINIGDFFGDLISVLPIVDLNESVRFGSNKELTKFFESIRQMRFVAQERQTAKDYLSGIKKIDNNEKDIKILPVDDYLTRGDMVYADLTDCIDYSYRFIFRLIEDLSTVFEEESLTLEKYFVKSDSSFKSNSESFFNNKKNEEYSPLFSLLEKKNGKSTDEILYNIFVKNSHKFKIITQYRKEKSVLEEYFISSSKRINKLILFSLLGLRFYENKFNTQTNSKIEIIHSIPEKQYIVVSEDKRYELNEAINLLIKKGDHNSLKRFISEIELNKIFLIQEAPYLVKSRRLRKYGLNIGDFVHFKGLNKNKDEKYLVFIKYTGSICDYYEIPINAITLRDLDYGWACNVHQLQGDEFPCIVIPFLGALYLEPTNKESVAKRNIKRFDSRALYTALTRVKISKFGGGLIGYFGKQYLDIIEEIEFYLRDTPFMLLN